ncbi:hypothetical protein C8J57DRAFT_1725029 [Mycena rebaudengoi]|nr:hypothetical protein C8J57DRAFT_1725029 [Mycena rebaudengoi]
MAEIAAGLAGAGTTFAAAKIATSAGFTGRHESSHRAELAEVDRNFHRYRSASQGSGSEMSLHDEDAFRRKLNSSQESLNEYYDSLNKYKDESRESRLARACVDDISRAPSGHGSEISSMYAESGSPPGSGLERERIEDWIAQSGDSLVESEPEAVGMGAPVRASAVPSDDDSDGRNAIIAEQKRRDELRNGYQRLRAVIPDDFLEGGVSVCVSCALVGWDIGGGIDGVFCFASSQNDVVLKGALLLAYALIGEARLSGTLPHENNT